MMGAVASSQSPAVPQADAVRVCVDAPPGWPHPAAARCARCAEHQRSWRRHSERQRMRRQRGRPEQVYTPPPVAAYADMLACGGDLEHLMKQALLGVGALLAHRAEDGGDGKALVLAAYRATHQLCAALTESLEGGGSKPAPRPSARPPR